SRMTSRSRRSRPAPAPASAGRQPRTVPTANTMVSASTNSTSEARKAARAEEPACSQMFIGGRFRLWPAPSTTFLGAVLQHLDLFHGDETAAHHAVEHGQEFVDPLFAIDDL